MKYVYAYKTSDGTRHEAAMDAGSREQVFAALRERGIRAIKVMAADGSKANGEVRGIRKRMVMANSVAAALVVGVVAFFLGESNNQAIEQSNDSLFAPRHQIYGDPSFLALCTAQQWANVFTNPFDLLLVQFAQPGQSVRAGLSLPADCPTGTCPIATNDAPEAVQMKQIVNGMKREFAEYCADGGTADGYLERLYERQSSEVNIYEKTKRELHRLAETRTKANRVSLLEIWNASNVRLRSMGLPTVLLPEVMTDELRQD